MADTSLSVYLVSEAEGRLCGRIATAVADLEVLAYDAEDLVDDIQPRLRVLEKFATA
ncbi:MAG: hypothetical protein U0L51_05150 [Olegusella sp.]|nr:hypothetical protein [Olegusella sp.]